MGKGTYRVTPSNLRFFYCLGTLRYDKCTGGWPLYWTQESICKIFKCIFLKTILGYYNIGPFSHAS